MHLMCNNRPTPGEAVFAGSMGDIITSPSFSPVNFGLRWTGTMATLLFTLRASLPLFQLIVLGVGLASLVLPNTHFRGCEGSESASKVMQIFLEVEEGRDRRRECAGTVRVIDRESSV